MDDRSHDPDAAAAAERAARAVRGLDVEAPLRLHSAVEAAVAAAERPKRRRRGQRLGAALAAATAVAGIAVILALGLTSSGDYGAGAAPTVPEAARVALAEPNAPAPAPLPGGRLDASIAGIDFPDWSRIPPYGWHATGERFDELGGRELRTVVYANESGQRFGYAIADGDALPWGGGEVVKRDGVPLWVYELDDATVVAWLRNGRTCILAGRDVDRDDLMALASSRNA